MSIKKASKLLIRQISAVVITFILLWLFSRVFIFNIVVLQKPITVTITHLICLALALVISVLVKGINEPLTMIFEETIKDKARAASGLTNNVLNLIVLAFLYLFLRSFVVAVFQMFIGEHLANITYDAIFIVVGLLILYGIVKQLTE